MNPAYNIQTRVAESVNTVGCVLYIDIGPGHVLYTILEPENNQFVVLQYFSLDKYNAFNQCKEILFHNDWLTKTYHKVLVSYNFASSLLVPESLYNENANSASLTMVYGDLNHGEAFSYFLQDWEMYNIYRVPPGLHQLLSDHFKQVSFFHVYTLLLKTIKAKGNETEASQINMAFYNNSLLCSLLQNGKLQLLKNFDYDTAEDVIYHLLNICRQFDVNCENITIKVSGFIDSHSSVYAELEKYFMNIVLDERPAAFHYDALFDEYPRHFFTTLFNTALCE